MKNATLDQNNVIGYRLADEVNGPFGEVFATLEEAEKELTEAIAEGNKLNQEHASEYEDAGKAVPDAADFFTIVEVTSNDIE